jgi:hypothetical protein
MELLESEPVTKAVSIQNSSTDGNFGIPTARLSVGTLAEVAVRDKTLNLLTPTAW